MKNEFHIYTIEIKDQITCVDGRCVNGLVRVGMTFTELCMLKDIGELEPQERVVVEHVQLVVKGIELYGKHVEEIDAGCTARIHLDGLVKRKDVLGLIIRSE